MPIIQVKVIENVFLHEQKREMIERLTDAMVEIEGEPLRTFTLVTGCCCCSQRAASRASP
jgi:4-oxalocrotonate tautomerase